MGRHAAAQDPLHVLYLGSSADLGALRRFMEAHGAVTRSRLTPAVTVVIADPSVSADHPTLRAAATLRIPVLAPSEAIAQYAGWRTHTEPIRQPVPLGARRSWPFRRRTR
ncbi:MAG: hypothetical protein ACRDSZ_15145 [Pseudonocardiaceae bacterium]